ncbi:MAG: tetratricopeptide repeat protein [Anaerolineales bacterium]
MISQLSLQLLGPLVISLAGRPAAAFEYDKVRALICYLAVEAGRPHRREALAGLLWPNHPEQAARASLRQALASLRQALGETGTEQPFLLVDRSSVQFNPAAAFQLDVAAFRQLLAACEAHRHRRLEVCRPCLQRLEQADLYRGSFLQQFSLPDSDAFEKWAMVGREDLQRRALAALHVLAEHAARRGDWPAAYHFAARQLALEPWREEAGRQAMRALACDGQRSAALAQFQTCAQALADELGVPPAAETIALHEQIRAGQMACAPAGGRGHSPPPAATTRFVGRQAELAELAEMLADPDCRLVTLSGPGGVGKTRLAQALLRELAPLYDDGAAFVPLADVEHPEGMPAAIAAALALKLQPDQPELEQLLAYLRPREMLLVLDNCEHLVDGPQFVAELLAQAARLTVAATSRHRLGLQAEWLYNLAGLDYPAADDDSPNAPDYPAVQLFVLRARQARPRFTLDPRQLPAVLRICRLTEGLPLAVELAAATIREHAPPAIAERIAAGLVALSVDFADLPERQRSIEATLAYSWALLPAEEQAAVVRLAAFHGSFDPAAAQAVAGTGPAQAQPLLDKSWLRPAEDAGRLSMHELLRQYAAEQHPAVHAAARTRHGQYYLRLAADQAPRFEGEQASQALAAVGRELDNIRAAWGWTLAQGEVATVEAATSGLAAFYQFAGLYREGAAAFRQAAEQLAGRAEAGLMSRLRLQQGLFEEKLGQYAEALAATGAALALAGAPGQRAQALIRLAHLHELKGEYPAASARLNEALELLEPPAGEAERAQALNRLGNLYWRTSDYAGALAAFQQALAADQQAGRASGIAQHLGNLGLVYKDMGEFAQAREYLGQALARAQALGHRENTGRFAQNLGLVYWQTGDLDRALEHYQRALQIARELDHKRGISVCLGCIGTVHRTRGEHQQALALQREALQLAQALGDKPQIAYQFGNIGTIYMDLRQKAPALEHFEQALALDRELGNLEGAARHLGNMGDVHKDAGESEMALAHFERSLALLRQVGNKYYLCWVLVATAETLFGLGRLEEAAALNEEGGRLAAEINRRDTLADSEALSARLGQSQAAGH